MEDFLVQTRDHIALDHLGESHHMSAERVAILVGIDELIYEAEELGPDFLTINFLQ